MKTQLIKHPLTNAMIEIPLVLADVQKSEDLRGVEIDQVGVCDLKYPISVLERSGGKQHVAAKISASVNLRHHFRGTHMSRFLEVLAMHTGEGESEMSMMTIPSILHELKEKLDAASARIEVEFTYFIMRTAPVSMLRAPMDY